MWWDQKPGITQLGADMATDNMTHDSMSLRHVNVEFTLVSLLKTQLEMFLFFQPLKYTISTVYSNYGSIKVENKWWNNIRNLKQNCVGEFV